MKQFGIPILEPEANQPPRKPRGKWNQKKRRIFREQTFPPRIVRDLSEIEPSTNPPDLDIWNGDSLYIYGDQETGKTIYAAQTIETIAEALWRGYQSREIIFISTPELFRRLKKSYDSKEVSESEIFEKHMKTWLLVLDDIGVNGKPSEWLLENLYLLINYRYENLLPTIFTSNFDLNKLAKVYGDTRITSRIKRMGITAKKSGW